MSDFFRMLETQRWDDHRYYHQSRINQSLHFVSAISFLVAYAWLLIDPPVAALIAWGISMTTRQSGHFFFEPQGYDHVNDATHEHKEAIKVGYNLRRKVVLIAVWAALPALLLVDRSLFGLMEPTTGAWGFWRQVGWLWLILGVAGMFFRVLQLAVTQSLFVGVVWMTKILTDPFHDAAIYWRAPFALMRGELLDPMHHVESRQRDALNGG